MDRKTDLRLWAVLFWLAVWQIAAMALAAVYPHGELLLASPVDVLLRLGQLAVTAAFWRTVAWSAVRIFGGFLLATVLAVALAALAAWKQWLRGLMAPLVAAVKTVPVASFIILALVWLNSQSLSLFISALMVFPPVYLNVLEGICRTDRRLLEMARVFRVPFGRRLRGIYLPQVMPISARRYLWAWAFAGKPGQRRRSSACPPGPWESGCTPPRSTSRRQICLHGPLPLWRCQWRLRDCFWRWWTD